MSAGSLGSGKDYSSLDSFENRFNIDPPVLRVSMTSFNLRIDTDNKLDENLKSFHDGFPNRVQLRSILRGT